MFRSIRLLVSALAIFVMVSPCVQAQDDKVFRALAPEAAEKVLQGLKVEFKKSASKKGDEQYYDFVRNNFRIRLTHFSPQELMLDCVFRGVPMEKVNQWNTLTKVSRASLHKDAAGEVTTLLEYGLDLSGGATEGTIKQFLLRFDDELKKYDKFIALNAPDDTILTTVSDEKLENMLKTLAINYKKNANAAGVMMFDFEMNGHKLRMYNFGGKDLMIDAHFRKIPLEDANRYNLSRKFIRVVNYKAKDVEYTSLEINFDCEAGVTESMVRHWLLSFGEDVRHFSEFTRKSQSEEKKK